MLCPCCQKENRDDVDYCLHCGAPLTDQGQAARISRFKWYFVGIVIFCIVMMLYLPR
jgi:predicted amidophosphoribosyltransferase